jgi:hypothetical protein
MLAIVDREIDLTMFVKIHNLIQNHKGERNGVTVIEYLDKAELGKMIFGEKLHVVGHGGGDSMGSGTYLYDAKRMAKTLVDRGLRGDIDSIKLSGCSTGALSTPTKNFASRYCQDVADEIFALTKNTKPIRLMVTGFTFLAVTDNQGKVRAKDSLKRQQLGKGYTDIMNKYKVQRDGWDKTAATFKPDTTEDFKLSAEFMAGISASMFAELYKYNPTVIQGKEDSKFRGLALADL